MVLLFLLILLLERLLLLTLLLLLRSMLLLLLLLNLDVSREPACIACSFFKSLLKVFGEEKYEL